MDGRSASCGSFDAEEPLWADRREQRSAEGGREPLALELPLVAGATVPRGCFRAASFERPRRLRVLAGFVV